MRTGTLLCWLFGHKFVGRDREDVITDGIKHQRYTFFPTIYCIRCGIERKEK